MSCMALKSGNQTIETSEAGIVFTDGARRIDVRWDQVIQYGLPRGAFKAMFLQPYEVRTDAGDFAVHTFLRNDMLFRRIIRHWAPAASIVASDAEMNALGGERARWTGGSPGVGDRVFHYRTRYARALLWPPIALSIASPAILLVQPISIWIVLNWLCFVVWFVLGYWMYRRERVVVSDAGITCVSALKSRFIPWENITEYRDWPKAARMTVSTPTEEIVIRESIVGNDELKREITRRAVNSVNKGWDTI